MSVSSTRDGYVKLRFSKPVDYIPDWYRLMKDPSFKINPDKMVSIAFAQPVDDENDSSQESPIDGIYLKSLEPTEMTMKLTFKNPE